MEGALDESGDGATGCGATGVTGAMTGDGMDEFRVQVSHSAARAVVRTVYGGDSYGVLSKRQYVEVDYLALESERKRARFLVVATRPPALLAHGGGGALRDLLREAQPLVAVPPPPPAQKHDDVNAYAAELGLLLSDAGPERRHGATAMSVDAAARLLALPLTRQQLYTSLERPQMPGLGALEDDGDNDLAHSLVLLPVESSGATTMHSAMEAILDEALSHAPAGMTPRTPLAALSENTANTAPEAIKTLELPMMKSICEQTASGSDDGVPQLPQEVTCMPLRPPAETNDEDTQVAVSFFDQQMQADLAAVEPPATPSTAVAIAALAESALRLQAQQMSLLELPAVEAAVPPLSADAAGTLALHLSEVLAEPPLPLRDVPKARALQDVMHEMYSHDLHEILAHSQQRLCLRPLVPPVMPSGPSVDTGADFLTEVSKLLPCPTGTLEMDLKPRTTKNEPCVSLCNDFEQLSKKPVIKPAPQPDRSLAQAVEGSSPMEEEAQVDHGGEPESVTGTGAEHLTSLLSSDNPSEISAPQQPVDQDEDKPAEEPAGLNEFIADATALQQQPERFSRSDATPMKRQAVSQQGEHETPMAPTAARSSNDTPASAAQQMWQADADAGPGSGDGAEIPLPTAMEQFIQRHNETTIVPEHALSMLIEAADQPSAWQRFRSECDCDGGSDTRGMYFQYCSMVDELHEEAEEHRPQVEKVIASVRGAAMQQPIYTQPVSATAEPQVVSIAAAPPQAVAQATRMSVAPVVNKSVGRKRKLKSSRQDHQPPVNLKAFIAEATGGGSQPERCDVMVPHGVSMCKPQLKLASNICNSQSTLVLLPLLAERSLRAVSMYNFVASHAGRSVLWLSEDVAALNELNTLLQDFCQMTNQSGRQIRCQIVSHHTDVRGGLKDFNIVMMMPATLDRAMRHDGSLPRMLASSTDVLAIDGMATAHATVTKYSRLVTPWLAEPRGSRGKTVLVFASSELPASGNEVSTVLQKLRMDRIICKHSTDPDIAAFTALKYPAVAPILSQTSPVLLTLQTHVKGLAEMLDISDMQKASLSSESAVLLANEAGQHIRMAHSIGDDPAKASWAEKYRLLVQILTCLEVYDNMADMSVESGLRKLKETISDEQGKAKVLKGTLDGLYTQLERAAPHSATPASTMTKLATVCDVLRKEQQRMDSTMDITAAMQIDSRASLSQQSFKALVLVADDDAAAHMLGAVQTHHPAMLLNGSVSASTSSVLASNAQVYIYAASSFDTESATTDFYQSFSLVITMCESVAIRSDPLLQQQAHANRVRHVAVAVGPAEFAAPCRMTDPAWLDEIVSIVRQCADGDGALSIVVDERLCTRISESAELNAAIQKASARTVAEPSPSVAINQQPTAVSTTEPVATQPASASVIVSNGVLRRNDILRHLESNGLHVAERDGSMTTVDMIITPDTGCLLLTLANVQACSVIQLGAADRPSDIVQRYMQGVSERLQQGGSAFKTIEVVVEHGAAGGHTCTSKGVQRLVKLISGLNKTSACKYQIRHSVGDQMVATPKVVLGLVTKHSATGTVSEEPTAEEQALVRNADGALNPMLAQRLLSRQSISSLTSMGPEHLQLSLRHAGKEVPLNVVENIRSQLQAAAEREQPGRPGPRYLGLAQGGRPR